MLQRVKNVVVVREFSIRQKVGKQVVEGVYKPSNMQHLVT